jgi:hypothetical protein
LKMISRELDDRVWVAINDQIAEVPRRA